MKAFQPTLTQFTKMACKCGGMNAKLAIWMSGHTVQMIKCHCSNTTRTLTCTVGHVDLEILGLEIRPAAPDHTE
jgi:hypothetical protein